MLNFGGVHDVHDIALDSLIDCPCDLTCKLSFAEAKVNGTHPQSNMPHQSSRSQKASTLETRAIKTRTMKWKTQGANPKHLQRTCLLHVAGGLLSELSSANIHAEFLILVESHLGHWNSTIYHAPYTMYHVPSIPMCPHVSPSFPNQGSEVWLPMAGWDVVSWHNRLLMKNSMQGCHRDLMMPWICYLNDQINGGNLP